MSRRRGKSAVRRYHDRVATRYDASYRDVFWSWHDSLTWDHIKAWLPRVHRSAALDLGCGTGKWGLRLLAAGCRVTFVDVSGGMIEQARGKVEAAGLADRAEFVQADLRDLSSLPAGAFAFAVALGETVGCAESPSSALKEVRRRLEPGGVLIATLDNRLAAMEHYLDRGDVRALATFLRTGRTRWLTRDADERFEIRTFTPTEATRLFEASGFDVIDMIGKTVLPMRRYRKLLDDPSARRTLAKVEKTLWRDPAAIGRAPHVQIVARRS